MSAIVDLRSDTLSLPTPQMLEAMSKARVGDEGRAGVSGRGEDPTINELEEMAADLVGKEAGLFVVSGTMGNLVSLMTHCNIGEIAGVDESLHVYHSEKGIFAGRPGGVIPAFYDSDEYGVPDLKSVANVIAENSPKVLCLENTNNYRGGTCLSKDIVDAFCNLAHDSDIRVHLDGARLFNACLSLGAEPEKLLENVDTVMFCLSKGLSAPVGSVLCGSEDFIFRARKNKKILGGTLRQGGVLAAAGIVALKTMTLRLAEDHRNARILADGLSHIDGITIRSFPQTNIVNVNVSSLGSDAGKIRDVLADAGLKCNAVNGEILRLVTYRGINEEDIRRAIDIFTACIERNAYL